MNALVVEAVGPLALVEDLGRPGHASVGVTGSGAADRRALRLANRLLGNAEGAAGVEVLLGGLAVRADGAVRVCVTGAPAPVLVDGRAAPLGAPLDLRDGQLLTLGMPSTGLRTYLAVRGGLAEPHVLGSASTDPTMGVGPDPLAPGRRLAVGSPPDREPAADVDVAAPEPPPVTDVVLRVVLGPRDDWFAPSAVDALTSQPWAVTAESDRVGVRLAGPALDRAGHRHRARAAQRGRRPRRRPGPALGPAAGLPRRPSDHGRLPRASPSWSTTTPTSSHSCGPASGCGSDAYPEVGDRTPPDLSTRTHAPLR